MEEFQCVGPTLSAAVYGMAGPKLSQDEKSFFSDCQPFGVILFARNIVDRRQVRGLTDSIRDLLGRNVAVFIDQEGGRVQRLLPPHWRRFPSAQDLGKLYEENPEGGLEAASAAASLIAIDLREVGVNVNCAPLIDLFSPSADKIIGDRAFSSRVDTVVALGKAQMDAFTSGGVASVIKHLPGHGRALADTHKSEAIIDAPFSELDKTDFVPFSRLGDAPMAMIAHVAMTGEGSNGDGAPASMSSFLIEDVIRRRLRVKSLLVTDDLGMGAISGSMADRAAVSLRAGSDIVMHCSGDMYEMVDFARGVSLISAEAIDRCGPYCRIIGGKAEVDPARYLSSLARLGFVL